ncbi:MAG: hypothetical protein ACQ5SW_00185 [Sphaerochaetaceae bacterium]
MKTFEQVLKATATANQYGQISKKVGVDLNELVSYGHSDLGAIPGIGPVLQGVIQSAQVNYQLYLEEARIAASNKAIEEDAKEADAHHTEVLEHEYSDEMTEDDVIEDIIEDKNISTNIVCIIKHRVTGKYYLLNRRMKFTDKISEALPVGSNKGLQGAAKAIFRKIKEAGKPVEQWMVIGKAVQCEDHIPTHTIGQVFYRADHEGNEEWIGFDNNAAA